MTTLPQASLNLFGFAKKLVAYNNGALIVMSAPPSFGISKLFDAIIADIPLKALIFPILVSFCVIFGYFIMWSLDFCYGLYAAKKAAGKGNEYFESNKAYSSIFKMFAVVSLIFILSLFSMIAAIGNWDTLSTIIISFAGTIGIMGILFDFASIGENYKKVNGNQHSIFIWFRKITDAIDEGFTSKIKLFFGNAKTPTI